MKILNNNNNKKPTWSCVHLSETTTMEKSFPLQDSITTWVFTGISLSKSHGEIISLKIQYPPIRNTPPSSGLMFFRTLLFLQVFVLAPRWTSLSGRTSSSIYNCPTLRFVESNLKSRQSSTTTALISSLWVCASWLKLSWPWHNRWPWK